MLDNHFHVLVNGPNLSQVFMSIKSYTSREIIKLLQSQNRDWLLNQLAYYRKRYKTECNFQVWQEGLHPQFINGEKMLQQKLDYIHNNPVRRGFVERPEFWRYSSARNFYLDDHSLMTLDSIWTDTDQSS